MKSINRQTGVSFWISGLVTICLAFLVAGCAGVSSTSSSTAAAAGSPTPQSGRLQEGDSVRVTFEVSTNLNTVTKVQLDGLISLPLVGQVQAIQKTIPELKADLVKAYAAYLKSEEISVSLSQANASVYVTGAVLKPGRIPMERPLTVLDAVMEAGGYDQTKAKISRVTVLRIEGGKQQTFQIDLQKALNGGTSQPFYLKPFDTVHVPEKVFHL